MKGLRLRRDASHKAGQAVNDIIGVNLHHEVSYDDAWEEADIVLTEVGGFVEVEIYRDARTYYRDKWR